MMALVYLIAALGMRGGPPENRFTLAEVNHVEGSFTQLIVWDWNAQYHRYDAQAWVMSNNYQQLTFDSPYRFRVTGGEHSGAIITAKIFRETRTQHDPERENHKLFPAQYRRKILR